MKVKSEVKVHEIDGKDVPIGKSTEPLVVESHWNDDDFVILRRGEMNITVIGRSLRAAIDNAENSQP